MTYALVNFSPVLAGVLSNVTFKCSSGEGGTDGKDLPVPCTEKPSDGGTYNIGNFKFYMLMWLNMRHCCIIKYEAASINNIIYIR